MAVGDVLVGLEYGPAPESATLAAEWLDKHNRKLGQFIGGQWREHRPDSCFDVFNPATGLPVASVSQADSHDVDAAVRAAKRALPLWWEIGPHERARHLYALARGVQRHSRLFSVLESLNNGKPIRESRDLDIPLVARHFYSYAGWAQLLESEMPHHRPVGVCGQIIPWNFPLLMLAWKIAPALASGSTVVLKPAEFTPLTALLFAELCQEVGLPDGVVNILTGDGAVGKLIVDHQKVDKIAFTGSTEVGRIIRRSTAGSHKKLSLELGGKSPFIVFDDADLDGAVEGVVDAIWFNQGQVCCAGSRLLVQESVADTFHDKLRRRMETLRTGDPLDKAVDLGAIVAPVQLDRIDELVRQGVQDGAVCFQPTWASPKDGWFYPPTLLTEVTPSSAVAQVEIFGPVLVSMPFRTPLEAIALANNTTYGLAASVWSQNIDTAIDVAHQVLAGTVWINCTNRFDAASGFGGYRESGYGREGGSEGLAEYLVPQATVRTDLPVATKSKRTPEPLDEGRLSVDRTHKHYIGGKQVRGDSGYSVSVPLSNGLRCEVSRGNRKDVRNGVEAARGSAKAWASLSGHARAQILFYVAENLSAEAKRMEDAIVLQVGADRAAARAEVEASINRTFDWAAWCDKFGGEVHAVPGRFLCYARREPLGVIGLVMPDDLPLFSAVSLMLPGLAMGNTVVALVSEKYPLPMVELIRILETSDVPAGVINLLTGRHDEMAPTLSEHLDVDAIWHFGTAEGSAAAEASSAGNLKRTWTSNDRPAPWRECGSAIDHEFLHRATQVKNVWMPYGA